MQLKYNVTEDDFINFNLFHIYSSPNLKRSMNLQRWLTPFLILLVLYVFNLIDPLPFWYDVSLFLVLSAFWILIHPKYVRRIVGRKIRKELHGKNNEGLIGDKTLLFTDDSIIESDSKSKTEIKWDKNVQLKEDERYFFLYVTTMMAFVIPKRDIAYVDEVRDYINDRIKTI